MLQQNFKSADELKLSEPTHQAAIKVLGMMERGEINDQFSMQSWLQPHPTDATKCQRCISGWVSKEGGNCINLPLALICPQDYQSGKYTIEQATHALRSYLVTGTPDWRT